MGTIRGLTLALAVVGAGCPARAADAPAPPLSPEDAWRERVGAQLKRIEMELAALDKQKAADGPPLDRVRAVHERLLKLEKGAMLAPGVIRGRKDVADISADVASLHTRVRAIADSRRPKPKSTKPATPPAPPPKPVAPERLDPKTGWPQSLRFRAKTKIVYEETGEWFITKIRRSGLGNDFLMDGYRGVLSISISAAGLKTEVASAELLVAVQMQGPFADDDNTFRIYEISWSSSISSSGTFGNDSLRNLPAYDTISVPGPIEWIDEPRKVTMVFPTEAHVVSVTLKTGDVIRFHHPQFTRKR